ncbi:unnamed protein product [Notodromas monacha]|uniref:Mediator of RNA polymerase II transcription subunit 19 n=1 Tax=Notodromas monacha TaxID=399045 RepID=A0A7R9BTC7_9CRUS|nr:unnamed protein product [Notodromas monacha]CAG0921383.1 unnamed protein product [Notodromas monacha]
MEQYSPKSSPRGPPGSQTAPRSQDTTTSTSGTLKTTICLGMGKTPSIVHNRPFYLMKELPPPSERTGATNLMAIHNLEHAYNKFNGKKVKDQLSSFLPNLPGVIDTQGSQDGSSLRSVIEKHRLVPKELVQFTTAQLAGFRLHPGPLPEQYRFMTQSPTKIRKHKQKRRRYRGPFGVSSAPGDSTPEAPQTTEALMAETTELPVALKTKHKKTKKHGDEERRKKKKEKKKKKQKNDTPPPPPVPGPSGIPSPQPAGLL